MENYISFDYKKENHNEEFVKGDLVAVTDDNGLVTKTKYQRCSTIVGICCRKSPVDSEYVNVAIAGVCECKITGNAIPGQLLTSSNLEGVATTCINPVQSTILGKAVTRSENDRVMCQISLG